MSEVDRDRLNAYAQRLLGDPAEAEDVVQEAIVRLPAGVACAPAWLHAVCYRIAVDRLRARKREARVLVEARGVLGAAAVEEAGEALGRREDAVRLRAAVDALPDPYRDAVRLRYLEGLEFPEVARRLGALERTARTWVGRGLAKLRERLERT